MTASVTDFEPRVESPCVRLCTLDENDICLGCHRSIQEICAWSKAGNDERRLILEQVASRAMERKRA